MISGLFGGPKARVFDAKRNPPVNFDPHDQEMLLQHAELGCVSFWCVTTDRAYPFVFRRRFVRGIVPYGQLIYCNGRLRPFRWAYRMVLGAPRSAVRDHRRQRANAGPGRLV